MACRKPPKNKKLTHRFKLYEQWSILLNRKPNKGDRFNKNNFKNKVYKVLVRYTESKFKKGELKPIFLQYSVVERIIEVIAGTYC